MQSKFQELKTLQQRYVELKDNQTKIFKNDPEFLKNLQQELVLVIRKGFDQLSVKLQNQLQFPSTHLFDYYSYLDTKFRQQASKYQRKIAFLEATMKNQRSIIFSIKENFPNIQEFTVDYEDQNCIEKFAQSCPKDLQLPARKEFQDKQLCLLDSLQASTSRLQRRIKRYQSNSFEFLLTTKNIIRLIKQAKVNHENSRRKLIDAQEELRGRKRELRFTKAYFKEQPSEDDTREIIEKLRKESLSSDSSQFKFLLSQLTQKISDLHDRIRTNQPDSLRHCQTIKSELMALTDQLFAKITPVSES
jgi:hypothetical protein